MTTKKVKNTPPTRKNPKVRINKPHDVKRLLTRGINDTLVDDMTTDKLRAISYACQTILKVFEIVNMEERLQRIEG